MPKATFIESAIYTLSNIGVFISNLIGVVGLQQDKPRWCLPLSSPVFPLLIGISVFLHTNLD